MAKHCLLTIGSEKEKENTKRAGRISVRCILLVSIRGAIRKKGRDGQNLKKVHLYNTFLTYENG